MPVLQLVVVTGNTGGPYTMIFASMTGKVLRKVPIPDEGITQGLKVVDGQILLRGPQKVDGYWSDPAAEAQYAAGKALK